MRDALKDLADQFWPGDAVGDGAVGVDASVVGDVSVGEAHEAVVLHNADTPRSRTRTPGLCVSGFSRRCRRYRSREPRICSRWAGKHICRGIPQGPWTLGRIALLARQSMVVACCVHIEMPIQQVVDVRHFGCELEQICDAVFEHRKSFLGWRCPGRLLLSGFSLPR